MQLRSLSDQLLFRSLFVDWPTSKGSLGKYDRQRKTDTQSQIEPDRQSGSLSPPPPLPPSHPLCLAQLVQPSVDDVVRPDIGWATTAEAEAAE